MQRYLGSFQPQPFPNRNVGRISVPKTRLRQMQPRIQNAGQIYGKYGPTRSQIQEPASDAHRCFSHEPRSSQYIMFVNPHK